MDLAQMKTLFAQDRFATDLCGIEIDEVTDTGARCSMPITPRHLNSNGTVQGGAIYTLCDTVFAVAANTGNQLMVSRSAEITYLKPGRGPCLYAEAECVARGGSTCLVRVSVYDQHHTLIACMTGNGYALRNPPAAIPQAGKI